MIVVEGAIDGRKTRAVMTPTNSSLPNYSCILTIDVDAQAQLILGIPRTKLQLS